MSEHKPTCWIVTEGIAGTENQCIGVAEALGLNPVIKRVWLKFPWELLSPWLPHGPEALTKDSSPIEAPWPDLLIASGRKSINIARYIRKASGGKTFVLQVQDPRIDPKHFDLVAVPQHDPARGKNVVVTTGSLHRVTRDKLDTARAQWQAKLAYLPQPRVAVLIGGTSKNHTMTKENAEMLARQIAGMPCGLMVTASRRTGPENTALLRERLAGPNVFFWDGTGDNPMFGFLALADYIIVTEDSVSMTSEALATGKPVYIAKIDGGSRRHDLFHKLLREQGFTRPFTGVLETWSYTPPGDMRKVAEEIKRRIKI